MTGRRVLAALGFILLATVVVPPAAAWGVNRFRVQLASAEVASIADALGHVEPESRDGARGADVFCGPGRVPKAQAPATERWVTAPRAALAGVVGDRHALSADPWGNCYMAHVAAGAAGESVIAWVLSAGPNGIIDTPFITASGTPAGDDVGMRVR